MVLSPAPNLNQLQPILNSLFAASAASLTCAFRFLAEKCGRSDRKKTQLQVACDLWVNTGCRNDAQMRASSLGEPEKSTCESKCFFQRCLPLRARDVASGSDVHCVSEVSPCGEVGKHHITASSASNITMRSITSFWRSQNFTKYRVAITSYEHKQKRVASATRFCFSSFC